MWLRKNYLLLVFIVILPFINLAQRNIQNFSGARSIALGNIKSSLDGADAIIHNFSQISFSTDKIHYLLGSEQRYNLKELSNIFAGMHYSRPGYGSFGLSFSKYGFKDFNEAKYGLSYARKVSLNLSISLNIDLNTFSITDYGRRNRMAFGLGLSGLITDHLAYSFQFYNLEKITIALNSEARGFIRFGFRYQLSDITTIHAEVEKLIDESITIRFGFEYEVFDNIIIRGGFNTNPGAITFGFAYKVSSIIIIEGGSQYNMQLGVLPSVSLKYSKA